jgi:hypothetical protein
MQRIKNKKHVVDDDVPPPPPQLSAVKQEDKELERAIRRWRQLCGVCQQEGCCGCSCAGCLRAVCCCGRGCLGFCCCCGLWIGVLLMLAGVAVYLYVVGFRSPLSGVILPPPALMRKQHA